MFTIKRHGSIKYYHIINRDDKYLKKYFLYNENYYDNPKNGFYAK